MFDVYYAGPQEFDPCNMAYVQLSEEKIAEGVDQAYNYILNNYGRTLSVSQMEDVFAMFDINYPLLDRSLALRFDDFDVYQSR